MTIVIHFWLFPPQYLHSYSPQCSLYISHGSDKESLFGNQEFLEVEMISFILVTFTFDLGLMLQGEIASQTLLRVKGLMELTDDYVKTFIPHNWPSPSPIIL